MAQEQPVEEFRESAHGSEGAVDEYGTAILSVLLQKHASSQRSRVALDVVGRLLSAAAVIYLGVVSNLSAARLWSGLLLAVLVAASWYSGRRRNARQTLSVEETLSRIAGGMPERAYIESRFIAEGGFNRQEVLLRAEPLLWLIASLAVIALSLVLHGLTT